MENGDLEKVLSNLAGIHSVKLVSDGNGNFSEVHVLATADKAPKQVARDIETAILAYTGKRIDRKIISVAQVDGKVKQEQEEKIQKKHDLRLVKISRGVSGDPVLEVTLEDNEREYVGNCRVPINDEKSIVRAAVLATIDALKGLEEYTSELESFEVFMYPSYKIIVAVFNTPDGRRVQAGFLEGDPIESGVKLTLEALLR